MKLRKFSVLQDEPWANCWPVITFTHRTVAKHSS